MFERFSKTAREVVKRSRDLAAAEGATSVEAHHLLIAASTARESDVSVTLTELGIDERTIEEARAREFRAALASVGVHTASRAPRGSHRLRPSSPKFGESAKLALRRTLDEAMRAHERRITERHLVLAVVSAEVGTTPRLLDELHVTPAEIRRALS